MVEVIKKIQKIENPLWRPAVAISSDSLNQCTVFHIAWKFRLAIAAAVWRLHPTPTYLLRLLLLLRLGLLLRS